MSFASIHKIIKKNKRFLVTTHVTPDPDALASELAVAMYLKSLKKQVFVINAEAVPDRYRFIPGAKMVHKLSDHQGKDYDVAIVVDCGDLNRVGSVKKIIRPQKLLVNIDHHITNDRFGDLNLVVPKASSTAEVIYELLEKNNFKLNRSVAILLYLGIMTDTGSFHYDNTASRTHEVVSHLLKFKFSVSELYRKLYETVPLSDLKYFTKIVSNFEIAFGGRVVFLELRKSMVRKFSQEIDLRDKIFKYLRTIKGIEVIVILTEQDRKRTKINLRSQSRFDVARLALHFGGGGHKKASGCMIAGNIKQSKEKLLAKIKKEIDREPNS
jgi:phosphoesterase RecJ-like protein